MGPTLALDGCIHLRRNARQGSKVAATKESRGKSDMGYFDGLISGSFKTTQDGRRLFFPWGVLGSGYSIASERDYQRLRQQVKGYMIVSLVLIIASHYALLGLDLACAAPPAAFGRKTVPGRKHDFPSAGA
jgi:hypothetical protein